MTINHQEIENDKPDVDSEGDEVADAPDRHRRLAAWGLEEKRHQPKASADNQRRRSTDFEQLIYDATTEFMQKQVDRAIANRARRSKTVLRKTIGERVLLRSTTVDYRGVDDCARCDLF